MDSADSTRRLRGRRGLDILSRSAQPENEVKIHEADFPDEAEADAKLIRLGKLLGAKIFTTNYNLGKIAELQAVPYVNIHELAGTLKTTLFAKP